MVNKYIKKRGERYSPQLLQRALKLISDGKSLRSVAKELCIQPMFLCRYIKKQNSDDDGKNQEGQQHYLQMLKNLWLVI